MKPVNAISLSVGLLVTLWCFLTFGFLEPTVITWITFLTWAAFFAAGGGVPGLVKAIACGFAGALAAALVMWLSPRVGGAGSGAGLAILSLLLGLLGWTLCQLSRAAWLSVIPASFIGAASFFGAGAPLDARLGSVLLSLAIGAVLGLLSQRLAALFTAREASAT